MTPKIIFPNYCAFLLDTTNDNSFIISVLIEEILSNNYNLNYFNNNNTARSMK